MRDIDIVGQPVSFDVVEASILQRWRLCGN